jgi:hypothetical protein
MIECVANFHHTVCKDVFLVRKTEEERGTMVHTHDSIAENGHFLVQCHLEVGRTQRQKVVNKNSIHYTGRLW